MVFKISKLLENGKINQKGLVSILKDHEEKLDELLSAKEDSSSKSEGSEDSTEP